MRIWLKRSAYVALVLVVLVQFVQPAKTNPAVDPHSEIGAVTPVDPGVASILNRSCNDCHSNQTVWPWYSNVAPVSWLVVRDVNEGRRELNLSEWGIYAPERRMKLLSKMCKEVREGEMPMAAYSAMHPGAKLSAGDMDALCNWAAAASLDGTRELTRR